MSFLQETQRLKNRKTRVVPILPGPRPVSQVKTAERWAHWAAQSELRLCPPRRHQSTCKSSLSYLQRAFSWPPQRSPNFFLLTFASTHLCLRNWGSRAVQSAGDTDCEAHSQTGGNPENEEKTERKKVHTRAKCATTKLVTRQSLILMFQQSFNAWHFFFFLKKHSQL